MVAFYLFIISLINNEIILKNKKVATA